MTDQTRAKRMADELDGIALADMTESLADDAAAELRRLSAVNADLLAALRELLSADDQEWGGAVVGARAAIARATEE